MNICKTLKSVSIFILITLATVNLLSAQNTPSDTTSYEVNEYDLGYNAITLTPFTIPKGSLVYQNLMLGVNTLEYGVTDKLSVAAGLSFFKLRGGKSPMMLLNVKYKFYDKDNLAFSINSLNAMQRYEGWREWPGTKQTISDFNHAIFLNGAHYKDKSNFFTFGIGVWDLEDEIGPIFTFGFSKRLSRTVSLIGDLWLPIVEIEYNRGPIPIPAIGFRYHTKSYATFDIGFPFIGAKVPLIKTGKSKMMSN